MAAEDDGAAARIGFGHSHAVERLLARERSVAVDTTPRPSAFQGIFAGFPMRAHRRRVFSEASGKALAVTHEVPSVRSAWLRGLAGSPYEIRLGAAGWEARTQAARKALRDNAQLARRSGLEAGDLDDSVWLRKVLRVPADTHTFVVGSGRAPWGRVELNPWSRAMKVIIYGSEDQLKWAEDEALGSGNAGENGEVLSDDAAPDGHAEPPLAGMDGGASGLRPDEKAAREAYRILPGGTPFEYAFGFFPLSLFWNCFDFDFDGDLRRDPLPADRSAADARVEEVHIASEYVDRTRDLFTVYDLGEDHCPVGCMVRGATSPAIDMSVDMRHSVRLQFPAGASPRAKVVLLAACYLTRYC